MINRHGIPKVSNQHLIECLYILTKVIPQAIYPRRYNFLYKTLQIKVFFVGRNQNKIMKSNWIKNDLRITLSNMVLDLKAIIQSTQHNMSYWISNKFKIPYPHITFMYPKHDYSQ